MARTYRILRRPWRASKPLYLGMIPELAGIVPLLVLFGLAQPDVYRTLFWRIGFEHHLNSDPRMILYAYANHRPLPSVPFVWSQTLTNFNVAISVLALFVLLAKMIATIMKVYYPIFGAFVGLAMASLLAVSLSGQAGPDYADSRYPSPTPWYLRHSCDIAVPYGAVTNCRMAKGVFAATVYLMFIYICQAAFAIWAMLPNKAIDAEDLDDEEDGHARLPGRGKDKSKTVALEMSPVPDHHHHHQQQQQQMPFTPRTQAFHTLERKLPLRTASA